MGLHPFPDQGQFCSVYAACVPTGLTGFALFFLAVSFGTI